MKFISITFTVPISQKTQCVSISEINQVMLLRKIMAVYSENHKQATDTLCGQSAVFMNYLKQVVHTANTTL
jgi:hypothetical protein